MTSLRKRASFHRCPCSDLASSLVLLPPRGPQRHHPPTPVPRKSPAGPTLDFAFLTLSRLLKTPLLLFLPLPCSCGHCWASALGLRGPAVHIPIQSLPRRLTSQGGMSLCEAAHCHHLTGKPHSPKQPTATDMTEMLPEHVPRVVQRTPLFCGPALFWSKQGQWTRTISMPSAPMP